MVWKRQLKVKKSLVMLTFAFPSTFFYFYDCYHQCDKYMLSGGFTGSRSAGCGQRHLPAHLLPSGGDGRGPLQVRGHLPRHTPRLPCSSGQQIILHRGWRQLIGINCEVTYLDIHRVCPAVQVSCSYTDNLGLVSIKYKNWTYVTVNRK